MAEGRIARPEVVEAHATPSALSSLNFAAAASRFSRPTLSLTSSLSCAVDLRLGDGLAHVATARRPKTAAARFTLT